MVLLLAAAVGSRTLHMDYRACGLVVGSSVMINDGEYNQEQAEVVGFGSLLLAEQLRFDHQVCPTCV